MQGLGVFGEESSGRMPCPAAILAYAEQLKPSVPLPGSASWSTRECAAECRGIHMKLRAETSFLVRKQVKQALHTRCLSISARYWGP